MGAYLKGACLRGSLENFLGTILCLMAGGGISRGVDIFLDFNKVEEW